MGVLNDYANAAAVNAALNKGVEASKAVSELKEDLTDLDSKCLKNYSLISVDELASQDRFYYSYENSSGKYVGWTSITNYTAHVYDVTNYQGG